MKIFLKITLAGLILLLIAFPIFSQSVTQIEQELVAGISEIQKYSSYAGNYDDEKMPKAQDDFQAKLLKYTKNPATLGYAFPKLKKLMFNATSDDGRFRIYSWDLEDGGTMHNFARVYQFRGADGAVYSKAEELTEEGGGGGFVTDIFTLDTKDGPVYIVCSTFIASTQDSYQSADLYRIDGDSLVDKVKLIKTKSGLTSSLGFGYNFFSVVNRRERPIRLISFDKKKKTLRIPVVIEDKEFRNGRVTNRFISYKFNGTVFVKVS